MNNSPYILVVEDNPIAQKIVTMHMTKQGCKVDTAIDGEIALEKAMHTHYDLILMDIGLGVGPDGFEVTVRIKQQCELNKTTPIIAVTAHDEPIFQDRAKECGMIGYFNKPFTVNEAEMVMDAWKKLSV